jgi:hypothetical protein
VVTKEQSAGESAQSPYPMAKNRPVVNTRVYSG